MGNENNQSDSPEVPASEKLSVLGEALGFGESKSEQPIVKPETKKQDSSESDPLPEQPLSDSDNGDELDDNTDNIDPELDEMDDDPQEDDPDSQDVGNNDPLVLLFDSETLYDIGEDKPITGEELKSRQLRQSDYTQKTQAIAEERNQLETERQGYADNLLFFDYANQNALSEFMQVNWQALSAQDPLQYQQLLGNYQQLQHRQQQIDYAKEQFLTDHRSRNAAQLEQKRVAAIDSLRGEYPDIEQLQPELTNLAKDVGFTEDELPQLLSDPRALKLLVNSHRVNVASKKAKAATKPNATPQPRPRATPSESRQSQTRKARLTKAANSGDQSAARALLQDALNSKKFDRFRS